MNNQSPGLSIIESSFDHYVRQRSTTVCGMQGVTIRGPVNVPTLCTSWEQFVRVFGGYTSEGYGAYAARAFFDNGGEMLYFSRIAHYSDPTDATTLVAAASTIDIADRSGARATGVTGSVGSNRIAYTALQPGTAGNSISVTLVVSGVSTPMSVAVVGTDITVNLATDATSTATSTVTQVLAAIANSTPASALITAASVETGVCAAVSKVTLSGGSAADESLTITAVSPGEWGDTLSVVVQNPANSSATKFDILVRVSGVVVETFRYLTMHSVAVSLGTSEYVRASVTAAAPITTNSRPLAGTYTLASGDDGLTGLDDLDWIGDSAARTGFYAFDDAVGLRLLGCPGCGSGAVQNAMAAYCAARKDVFAVFETDSALTETEALDYLRGTGNFTHAAFDNSYGALYWPWLRITDPLTRAEIVAPPSGAVLGCYVRSDKLAKEGVGAAPAGEERAVIRGVLGVERLNSRPVRDLLYPEGINPIAQFPESGVVIMGQRTLEQDAISTDRVNGRREMIFLETTIESASRFVVFRPNLPETWRELERAITPILTAERDKGAITDYRFQCDEATNPPELRSSHVLKARIFVKLTPTGEFVEIEFVKTDVGTSFTEIYGS